MPFTLTSLDHLATSVASRRRITSALPRRTLAPVASNRPRTFGIDTVFLYRRLDNLNDGPRSASGRKEANYSSFIERWNVEVFL